MTIGERERDDEGDRHQDGDTATTAVLFGATPRKTTTTCGERPHSDEEPREEFDAADQDSGLGHEANIFVDDVADLVRGCALQLIAGQRSQQGGCESDGTFLGRATDGEGIGCAVVDDMTRGIPFMPAAIDISSTTFQSRGWSFFSISRAPTDRKIARSPLTAE